MSCDIQPTEQPGPHYQGDVRDVLYEQWDLMIAHPDCTYLTNSGVRWLDTDIKRWKKLYGGAEFFRLLNEAKHIPKRVTENPIPHKYALALMGRKYDQIIQPWQFGHKEMKATCLWLEGVPPLFRQTSSGHLRKDRSARNGRSCTGWRRGRTGQGIAAARIRALPMLSRTSGDYSQ